ncbi:divergent polysaccharide deacetylase family protein [Planktotalea sp.]|uniref:divergent polysaccharide deacetylase family protein n=1 Tax=Planktotalea sp. TaxID=2029877 RepID=UPI003F6ACCF3
MAKGAFSGVIWGAVVAVAGAGGLSLAYPDFKPGVAPSDAMMEQPEMAETETAPVESVDAPDSDAMASAEPAQSDLPETDAVEAEADIVEAEGDALETDMAEVETPEPEAEEVVAAPANDEVFDPSVEPEPIPEPTEPEPTEEVEAEVAAAPEAEVEPTTTDLVETVQAPTEEPSAEENATAQASESITDEIIAALPQPEQSVEDPAPAITTGRLPTLSDDDDADAPSAVAPPPFERFASSFEADSDKPRMAIVLIDTGEGDLGVEALESFPYPLTFAVDTSQPDATDRMQVYREKGFEVLALVDLPRGATPSDVEIAMSAHLSAVPEAVGILEGVDTGVQTSREMADQLTQIVLASGHGMLFQKSGLNTARKLAEREGIPAGTVFRDFDGNDQSASVMRRFLDQAAFRAGQEGGVIMMGRLQAETISALLIWGLADRASRVALVPVSQVLKQDDAPEG